MTERATLVLGPAAGRLRRELGPVAWSALEVLAATSACDGQLVVARVGVRRLAEEMGVAKNTAARAARALMDSGLLKHAQRRTAAGRFERGLYVLALPQDALAVDRSDGRGNTPERRAGDAARPPRGRAARAHRTGSVEQLALLPE